MKQDLYNNDWIEIDGNRIHKTAVIHPNVELGKGNTIGAYAVIGSNGEIRGKDQLKFQGKVFIGNGNVISEHVTIQRPFDDGKKTVIGDYNIIMAHVHVGHDAFIGTNCEICTATVIGGYASIYEGAKIKIGCMIRNRVIVGVGATVGMGSVVTKDVVSCSVVYGNPAKSNFKPVKSIDETLDNNIGIDLNPKETETFAIIDYIIIGSLAGILAVLLIYFVKL